MAAPPAWRAAFAASRAMTSRPSQGPVPAFLARNRLAALGVFYSCLTAGRMPCLGWLRRYCVRTAR